MLRKLERISVQMLHLADLSCQWIGNEEEEGCKSKIRRSEWCSFSKGNVTKFETR